MQNTALESSLACVCWRPVFPEKVKESEKDTHYF